MRLGSLFSGYGGLDMGVQSVLGGEVAWHCDNDPGASRILAHHWPDVPNLGDITKVDWTAVEPVDVITGGFPCQDVSHAGKRAGLGSSTRTGLWSHMALAIETLRPRLVVAENVRGLLSARADSDMEPCPWCLGDGEDEPPMRALGAVLAELADIGYDARWCGIRAADVGAPHGRFRVFVVASDSRRLPGREGRLAVAREAPGDWARRYLAGRDRALVTVNADRKGWAGSGRQEQDGRAEPARASLVAPDATRDGRDEGRSEPARLIGRPHAAERGASTPDAGSERHGRGQNARGVGRVDGGPEGEARQRERARAESGDRGDAAAPDAKGYRRRPSGDQDDQARSVDALISGGHRATAWGAYEPAIRRWERVLGRPAPAPTKLSEQYVAMRARRLARRDPRPVGMRGSLAPRRQLSPNFCEWLMGLPEGHVCDVPGLTRNAMLRALGNGVVWQQAAAALRILLPMEDVA